MNDRFALAFMLSLGMHALLLGLVAALGLPQTGRVESSVRMVIPVTLLEAGSSLVSSAQGEGSGGEAHPDPTSPAASPPSTSTGPATRALAAPTPIPRASDPARSLPGLAAFTERDEPTVQPASAAELRESSKKLPAAPALTGSTGSSSPADAQASDDAGVYGAAPGAGASGAASGFSGGTGGDGRDQGQGSRTSGQGDVLIPGEFLAGNSPPRYPLLARRKGWEGTVVIEIHVSGSGRVEQARVEKSSGYAILDGAALGAIRSWRIALNSGQEEADLRFRIPVIFKLKQA